MTEIKILIYTDIAKITSTSDAWAVTMLRGILEAKTSRFVEFKLSIINRYEGATEGQVPTPVRITEELLKDVDEVWFFGFYHINGPTAKFGIYGSDQNILSDDEVKVLEQRMNEHGLGVLISGDHSIDPLDPEGNQNNPVETFVCLGKALGSRVPRARQLRMWDGPPTSKVDKTAFSTIAEAEPPPGSEVDRVPQRLALFNFAAGGSPRPHRLFWGRDENGQDRTIDILPDHMHEGEVIVPESLGDDWHPLNEPDGKKKRPRPVVVAFGFDRRVIVNRASPALAVYDGDPHNVGDVKVGRIVADSSWHHFFDGNLKGLAEDPTAFDLLGQFYRNLAFYLAPLEKRQQIAGEMLKDVITHPGVMEEMGSDAVRWGRVTRFYLSRIATPFEMAEVLQVVTPGDLKATDPPVDFKALASGEADPLPTQEELLGSIVRLYYRVASEQLKNDLAGGQPPAAAAQPIDDDAIIEGGIRNAFRNNNARLVQLASAAQDFSARLNQVGAQKEDTVATICQGTDDWVNSKLKPNGKPVENDGTYQIVKKADGTFTGTHTDKDGNLTTLRSVTCGGVNGTLSFVRDNQGNQEISYAGTIVPDGFGGFKIADGRFSRHNKLIAVGAVAAAMALADTGDWQSEKPTF